MGMIALICTIGWAAITPAISSYAIVPNGVCGPQYCCPPNCGSPCFTNLYLNDNPASAGDITFSGSSYSDGSSVVAHCNQGYTLQAMPSSGMAFQSWSNSGSGYLSSSSCSSTTYTAGGSGSSDTVTANYIGQPLDALALDNLASPGTSYTTMTPPGWTQDCGTPITTGLADQGPWSTSPGFGYGEPRSQTDVYTAVVDGYNLVDITYLQVGGSDTFGPVPGNVTLAISMIQPQNFGSPVFNATLSANFIPSSAYIYNAGDIPSLGFKGNLADAMANYSNVLQSIALSYGQTSNQTLQNIGTDYDYISNAVNAFAYWVLGTGPFVWGPGNEPLGNVYIAVGSAMAAGVYVRTYQCVALAAIDFAHTLVTSLLFPERAVTSAVENELLVQGFGGALIMEGMEATFC